jgi:hypothetical protein
MGSVRRGAASVETYAEQAAPKSTPHPGRPFGTTGLAPVATPKATCQPRASRDTVAFRTTPPTGRDRRNWTQPSFGSRTSAHRLFSLRTATACPGKGTDSSSRRFLNLGGPVGCSGSHQLS